MAISDIKKSDILKEYKENICRWYQYWGDNIDRYKTYTSFMYGSQWDSSAEEQMRRINKIPIIINKLYPLARRIIGEQRQNTPGLQVLSAVDGDTEEKKQSIADRISLMQDIVNTIASSSDSQFAYQNAFQNALMGGFGAIEVDTEYENNKDFNQRIKIKAVKEPYLCFWDPAAQEPSKCDGEFSGCYYYIGRDKFEEMYPDVNLSNHEEYLYFQSGVTGFESANIVNHDDNKVAILLYQKKEWSSETIVLTKEGLSVSLKQYNEAKDAYLTTLKEQGIKEVELPAYLQIDKKRKVNKYKIMSYKIANDQILESSEWPSLYFKNIFVDQDSYILDGTQVTLPFFYGAKDTQTMINFLGTQTLHLIKTLRNEKYMATPDNVKGFEYEWKHPYLTQGFLPANPDPITQQMPITLPPTTINPAVTENYDRFVNDIQSSVGIYDAYAGAQGNEISGHAIGERVKQGNKTTFTVFDSLNRGIEQVGRIILNLIPVIYDSARSLNVNTSEGESKVISINQPNPYDAENPYNQIKDEGYSIEIDPGSSSEKQKEEALEAFRELFAAFPQAAPLMADLYAKNIPLPNTLEIVRRLATTVPPNIIAAGKGKPLPPAPPPPPSPQEQMMQAELQIKQEELKAKHRQMDIEQERLSMEAAREVGKNEVQKLKSMAEVEKAQLEHSSTLATHHLKKAEHALEATKIHHEAMKLLGGKHHE